MTGRSCWPWSTACSNGAEHPAPIAGIPGPAHVGGLLMGAVMPRPGWGGTDAPRDAPVVMAVGSAGRAVRCRDAPAVGYHQQRPEHNRSAVQRTQTRRVAWLLPRQTRQKAMDHSRSLAACCANFARFYSLTPHTLHQPLMLTLPKTLANTGAGPSGAICCG